MTYIVIDTFGKSCNIVTNEEGNTLYFEDIKLAQEEANDCQEAIIVPISTNRLFTEE